MLQLKATKPFSFCGTVLHLSGSRSLIFCQVNDVDYTLEVVCRSDYKISTHSVNYSVSVLNNTLNVHTRFTPNYELLHFHNHCLPPTPHDLLREDHGNTCKSETKDTSMPVMFLTIELPPVHLLQLSDSATHDVSSLQ